MSTQVLADNLEFAKSWALSANLMTAGASILNTMYIGEILALKLTKKTDTDKINTFKEYSAKQTQQIGSYKLKCLEIQHTVHQKDQ